MIVKRGVAALVAAAMLAVPAVAEAKTINGDATEQQAQGHRRPT